MLENRILFETNQEAKDLELGARKLREEAGAQRWALFCWHRGHTQDCTHGTMVRAHHLRQPEGVLEGVYYQGPVPQHIVKPGAVIQMASTTDC